MLSRNLLTKTKNCRFFSAFYTWGNRTVNLGHENETMIPQSVDTSAAGNITNAAMGKNHTLLLNSSGELYGIGYGGNGAIGTGGTDQYDTPQRIKVGSEGNSVVDFDAGKDFSIAATSNGNVYTWGKSQTIPDFVKDVVSPANPLGHGSVGDLRTPTRVESLNGQNIGQVAAGDYHSIAVSTSGDQVWMWGNGPAGTFCDPFVQFLPYPSEVEEINSWLSTENKTIADVKASGDSTVVLTTDGQLWGWGGNEYGQLANNHDRLQIKYKGVYEPYQISGYEGTVQGFDISNDVIVFWTDANVAYWAGRYEQFVPQQVTLPLGGNITSVGASQSGYAITTDTGDVYSFGETLPTDKKFFDQGLSLSNTANFGGNIVTAIGGSFENGFAIAQ